MNEGDPAAAGLQYCASYCCKRKMLKTNWNWRNNRLFLTHFCHWWNFNWGDLALCPPNGYANASNEKNKKGVRKFSARFLAFSNKISTVQKILLSSSRGLGNFRGPEASRPRTSKCVLEAKNVLEDSTSRTPQENRRHWVTIWIRLWLPEKISKSGIRTHACNNQRYTLVLKTRQFFNAEQMLNHSTTVANVLKQGKNHVSIDWLHTEIWAVTLRFRCSRCVCEGCWSTFYSSVALSWFNFFIKTTRWFF